jgi:hypothetical protein
MFLKYKPQRYTFSFGSCTIIMTNYREDRSFSDDIHWRLAMPQVYEPLGWSSVLMNKKTALYQDLNEGIDYVFRDDKGKIITVQERFREAKYHDYADFTVRYRRDQSQYTTHQQSEFYKIQADVFLYGITNGYKPPHTAPSGFLKWAMIDLAFIKTKIEAQQIIIRDAAAKACFIENNAMICPIQHNRDGSSSFFPIDIGLLYELWHKEPFVVQIGFL